MRRVFWGVVIIVVGGLVSLLGCSSPQKRQQNVQESHIPPGFVVKETLGNEWYVIEGKVQGKTRKYLYRYRDYYDQTTETIVEIKD